MSSIIAVVGAGPGLGRAIARRFGSAGHPVALVSRNRDKLAAIAVSLRGEGITAGVFPADVTDEPGLAPRSPRRAANWDRSACFPTAPAPPGTMRRGGSLT